MPLDRLDRLAVASTRAVRRDAIPAHGEFDERFSRADAVRRTAAAAAAVWLGGAGRALAASSSDLGTCLKQCNTDYRNELNADLDSCSRAITGHNVSAGHTVKNLGRFFLIGGPEAVKSVLAMACTAAVVAHRQSQLTGCKRGCHHGCDRQTQSARAAGSTCEATTPPATQTPALPQAPTGAEPTGCGTCTDGVWCPCGAACGFSCATYRPSGPGATENCDVCKRNCVGEC